ncbi:MAG TPA: helix-turn-helix domain-containing protein [Thermoleophilaceae bacterium]
MSSQVSYEQGGRSRQKARTRAALIDAARELLGEGVNPTVEASAARAGISRATAYRYFPNLRSLLAAARPQLEAVSLLGDEPPPDPAARLRIAVDGLLSMTLESEAALRAMLRLSLEPGRSTGDDLAFRSGRRIGWIAEALAPLREELAAGEFDRLVTAIATAVGIDALVWLTDVAGHSREEAAELMRWSAQALLRGALA